MKPALHPIRPDSISTKGCCVSPQQLEALLQKSDGDLDWDDYATLFNHSTSCVGTYEELLYFVKPALAYAARDRDDALEFLDGLIGFLSEHEKRLARDGLTEDLCSLLTTCLDAWCRELDFVSTANEGFGQEGLAGLEASCAMISGICERLNDDAWPEAIWEWLTANSRAPIGAAWILAILGCDDEGCHGITDFASRFGSRSIEALFNDIEDNKPLFENHEVFWCEALSRARQRCLVMGEH